MPAALSVRPSRLVPVATMRPPTSLRPASRTVCLTFLASVSRIGSRPDSSKTGVMLPSAAVENEISGARLVPAIVQLSLPRATTTSAAIRSAAAFAASAEAVATAGAQRHDRHGHRDRRRRVERRELRVERGQQGRLVDGATVLRGGDAERPALAGRHGGVHGGLVDRRGEGLDGGRQLVAVVGDGGVEGDAVDRGLGCADEVRERIALAARRECRVEQRRGVGAAAHVGVADGRRLAVRAGERDLPGAEPRIGVRDLPPAACSRVSPPRSVLPTRTPGRTRPSYCWPHAYRPPTPMPTASRRPRTNDAPKRRASDRRRRGRAGGSPSVTAAATGRTGTASTPGSEAADASSGAVSAGSPDAGASAMVASAGEGSASPAVRRPGRAPPARGRRRASRRRVWRRRQPGRLRSRAGRSSDAHAVGRRRASSLAAATFSRVHANLSRRRSARPRGTGTRDAPQTLRGVPRDLRARRPPPRAASSRRRDPSASNQIGAPTTTSTSPRTGAATAAGR